MKTLTDNSDLLLLILFVCSAITGLVCMAIAFISLRRLEKRIEKELKEMKND